VKISNQQKQTKRFFDGFSKGWSKNAKSSYKDFVNIVKIRNSYCESQAKKYLRKNGKTLDIGCGSGDLVISFLQKKYDGFGLDFAKGMITKAKNHAKKLNFDTNRFTLSSFFDFNSKDTFDMISANGVIEYISINELDKFIKKSRKILKKNGIFVLESRNRLFNAISFNNYTMDEIKIKEINHILEECIIFNNSSTMQKLLNFKFKSKIKRNLKKHDLTDTKYAKIKVDIRNQYTPFELFSRLRKNGFKILDISPVHIHALTTGAKNKRGDIHTKLAYFLEEHDEIKLNLIPQCSSFMITCQKK